MLAIRPCWTHLRGQLDFVLANPPSSDGDDGFTFRRIVLRDSAEYLNEASTLSASEALRVFRKEGIIPLSRWQTHLYRRAN